MKTGTGVLNKIFGKKQNGDDDLERALAAVLAIESKLAAANAELAVARGACDDATAADIGGAGKPGAKGKLAVILTEKRQEVSTLARLLNEARLEAQNVLVAGRGAAVEKMSETEAELFATLQRVDWRRAKKIAELAWSEDLPVKWPTEGKAGSIVVPVFSVPPDEVATIVQKAAETPRAADPDAGKIAGLRARLDDLNVVRAMPPEMGLDLLLSRRRRGQ